jgi:type I restriction enzyme M protein
MRGQDLGQFFTPRSVVKFMVRMADLFCSASRVDTVLDGCCGTGGFLIEAMTVMDQKLQSNIKLSNTEREALQRKLRTETLWGIDAGKDPPIARIARLNMLLHRDGGSRIYFADALDQQVEVDPSLPDEIAEERQELRREFAEKGRQFDVILTNPPFSMEYEWDKPADRRVLEQYFLSLNKKGKPRASLRSAVMFLERYEGLLKPGGKLLTVMDESVLNTVSMRFVRDFLRDRFVVVAVISLPINTFAKAGGSVKTSVLYLRKKTMPNETQPAVFMAVSESVGHDDAGKPTPEKNDLPAIYAEFEKFMAER